MSDIFEFAKRLRRAYRIYGAEAESQNYQDIESWFSARLIDARDKEFLHRCNQEYFKELMENS